MPFHRRAEDRDAERGVEEGDAKPWDKLTFSSKEGRWISILVSSPRRCRINFTTLDDFETEVPFAGITLPIARSLCDDLPVR